MIAVTFALPDESRDFVARQPELWSFRGHGRGSSTWQPRFHSHADVPDPAAADPNPFAKISFAVIYTGVGNGENNRRAFAALLHASQPRLLIASGFAGGLRPELRVGDLVLGENFSAPALLADAREALAGEPLHIGVLTTVTAAAETAAVKAALAAATGALAVDMETAWIADACARADVPMLSLRVISDAAGQDFPVPGAVMFDQVRQRPRYLALPAYLLSHPARLAPFVRFVRGLGPARARLAGALERVIGRMKDEG